MRAFWAILLGGLTLLGTAEARLGESKEQVIERYGNAQAIEEAKAPWDFISIHSKEEDDYVFMFMFLHSKVAMMFVLKAGGDFKEEEVKKFLKENQSGDGFCEVIKDEVVKGVTLFAEIDEPQRNVMYEDFSGRRAMWGRSQIFKFGVGTSRESSDVVVFYTDEAYKLLEKDLAKERP